MKSLLLDDGTLRQIDAELEVENLWLTKIPEVWSKHNLSFELGRGFLVTDELKVTFLLLLLAAHDWEAKHGPD